MAQVDARQRKDGVDMTDWPRKMYLNKRGTACYLGPLSAGLGECTEVLVYPADQAPEPLTDEQCDEFRRHIGSFNDMVRHIYESGAASSHGRANEHFGNYYRKKFESLTASSAQAPEPVAWVEKAIAQTWKLIDPLRPPPPGTYARGHHEGIALALSTLRDHLSNPPPSEFAIRASERERCAKVCEAMTGEYPWKFAAAIRELGNE